MQKATHFHSGGVNVIFAGDFAQLPPFQTRLYANLKSRYGIGTAKKERKMLGRLLWLTIDTVVELKTNMRQQGDKNKRFSELLGRLRMGKCNEADYELLKGRVIGRHDLVIKKSDWASAPVIVSDNTAKDALNERYAIEFAERTNQTLHWYYSSDKCKGSILSNEELLNHLQSVHSGKTKGRLGRLPLVLGMPVLLAQNFDVEDGIVNGSRGIVKRIRYKTDSEGKRFLTSVVVEVPGSNEEAMPHLKPCEVPVLSDSIDVTFQSSRNVHGNVTIKRTQVPVVPAFAMTAHRSQGQTLTKVIVDLQSCRGSESPYVMLSRVTSLEGLLILRPFSKTKICCKVSEDLRLENR